MEITCPFLTDSFNDSNHKIFNIEFDNWTQDDIEDWLEFAGLPDSELEIKANRLYRRGRNGLPIIVRDAIEKEFCKA